MKIILTVFVFCLIQFIYSRHFIHQQGGSNPNPAFNNWVNNVGGTSPANAFNKWLGTGTAPNPPPNTGNPAFGNWLNNQPQPQPGVPNNGGNPAFNNWLNRPGQPQPQPGQPGTNPAFNNWLNNGARPGTPTTPGNPAFNNWLNNNNGVNPNAAGFNPLNDAAFANALRGQIGRTGGAVGGLNANDNAFRAFLQANNVPNATQLPTLQECARYTIRAAGNIIQQTPNNYKVTCSLPGGREYTENCFGQQACDYLTCKFLKCSQVPGGRVFRVKI